jgi:large subunit ribosomal protein L21
MYAVVDIKGFQYKIEKGETLRVPKLDLEVGSKIQIPDVLLVNDGENIAIGTPFVQGAVAEFTVIGQAKDKKIIVFKKKRRKDYSVKRGHRQDFTEIVVDNIQMG